MPKLTDPIIPDASALTGSESFYVVQSSTSTRASGEQARALSQRGLPGQCRLSKSGSNLLLMPHNGNLVTINNLAQAIPDAGVTLPPSGLTPDTLYYIYVFISSGTMTLEASTSVPLVLTSSGIKVKTGDASKTLVAMVRPISGPSFTDSVTQRFVRSYFNRQAVHLFNSITTQRSITATSATPLHATEGKVEFLCWDDELISAHLNGFFFVDIDGNGFAEIGFDAGLTGTAQGYSRTSSVSGSPIGFSTEYSGLSEGYHYAQFCGHRSLSNQVGFSTGSSIHLSIR